MRVETVEPLESPFDSPQYGRDGRFRWTVGYAGLSTPCWIWLLYRDRDGYGKVTLVREGQKTTTTAQRWVYEEIRGQLPEGMTLDHLCPNRCCVNPSHLDVVTHVENVRRSRVQKLTQEVADAIRARQGLWSGPRTAEVFGVSSTTVYDIWSGKRWAA